MLGLSPALGPWAVGDGVAWLCPRGARWRCRGRQSEEMERGWGRTPFTLTHPTSLSLLHESIPLILVNPVDLIFVASHPKGLTSPLSSPFSPSFLSPASRSLPPPSSSAAPFSQPGSQFCLYISVHSLLQ